jgi:capsular exopolysaccharide synthesis family protein
MTQKLAKYFYLARRAVMYAIIPAVILGLLGYFVDSKQPRVYASTVSIYVSVPPPAINSTGGLGATSNVAVQLAAQAGSLVNATVVTQKTDAIADAIWPNYHISRHFEGTNNPQATDSPLLVLTCNDELAVRAAKACNVLAHQLIAYVLGQQQARWNADEAALRAEIAHNQDLLHKAEFRESHGTPAQESAAIARAKDLNTEIGVQIANLNDLKAGLDNSQEEMSITIPARVRHRAISPRPLRMAVILGVTTLLICGGGVYLWEKYDFRLRSPEEVEAIAGAPILGTIPIFAVNDPAASLITVTSPRSQVSEAYRLLRTNIQFTDVDKSNRVIVVTSCLAKEGKSTTVSNLAQVFAEGGSSVVVIDTDLRRPSLHRVFGVDKRSGLTSALAEEHLNGHGIYQTTEPNLSVMASGPLPPNPADVLSSGRMKSMMRKLVSEREIVLLDSPPILSVADASVLTSMADGVVLVVDLARTKRRDLERARDSINAVGGNLLGIVVNRLSPQTSGQYYYYYSHYGYAYRSEEDSRTGRGGIAGIFRRGGKSTRSATIASRPTQEARSAVGAIVDASGDKADSTNGRSSS